MYPAHRPRGSQREIYMGTRILGIIVAVLIVVGIYYGYQHYKQDKANDSGAVTCVGCMTPEQKAAFDREDHGETADGQSEHKMETSRQAAAAVEAGTPSQMPPQNMAQGTAREPLPQRIGGDLRKDEARVDTKFDGHFSNNGGSDTTAVQSGAPAYDTAPPNAANGMRFGGAGVYQWYRQGSLTWRVDTATGRSCIVYATMEEGRKQIVLSHGCGRDA